MYLMARTATQRPTLQHILQDDSVTLTLCGVSARRWSRTYQDEATPVLLCKRCTMNQENR